MNTETGTRDEFFESLLGDFLDESGQLLDRLNENLLQLDGWVRGLESDHHERCDASLLNEMFRSAHSLKGLSAMLGLKEINTLTHKVENVFDAARKDELVVSGNVVDLMFQAVDRLGGLVESLKEPAESSVDCQDVLEGIRVLLESHGVARTQTSQADAERALQACTDGAPKEIPAAELAAASREIPVEKPTADPAPVATTTAVPAAQPAARKIASSSSSVKVVSFEGVHDEAEISRKYLAIFLDEAEISLDSLTETLLALEGASSQHSLENLLITSHRIKGSAASVGLNRVAKLAHLMEDQLQGMKEQHGALSAVMADALLKCTDGIRQYVRSVAAGEVPQDRFGDLACELAAAGNQAASGGVPAPAATVDAAPVADTAPDISSDSIPAEVRQRAVAAAGDAEGALVGRVVFQAGLALAGLKARLVYEKLGNHGEVVYFDPPADRLEEVEHLDVVHFAVISEMPLATLQGQLRVGGVRSVRIEPVRETPAIAATPSPARAAAVEAPAESGPAKSVRSSETSGKPNETLRVDIERLDQLMKLAGQLVISKARFSQIGESLKNALVAKQSQQVLNSALTSVDRLLSRDEAKADPKAELELLRGWARRIQTDLELVRRDVASLAQMRGSVGNLFEAIHQLERVADGIQRNVMDTRMVPIGPLFTRFRRVIRDITRGNGKQIELEISGEKTELDKRMIDELGDPLIHMVRNSADHGIESPEVREAAGKPRHGRVTLNAFHRGNNIVIEVRDDGKGLDADRIRTKAIERGLISEADAERMTRQQIFQLIWEPGLSTAEKITEVSGRGMGMDIVKSKIEELHGAVELDSIPGQGTTFTIKLPLTLAILPSLMVQIGSDIFAMPVEAVAEIVSVGGSELNSVHGRQTARVRERVISVVQLEGLFAWDVPAGRGGQDGEDALLVVLGEEGHEIGLQVDRVLGEEDVVIKSMSENYRNVQGIAGASIMGDGRVSLILDIATIIGMASQSQAEAVVGEA